MTSESGIPCIYAPHLEPLNDSIPIIIVLRHVSKAPIYVPDCLKKDANMPRPWRTFAASICEAITFSSVAHRYLLIPLVKHRNLQVCSHCLIISRAHTDCTSTAAMVKDNPKTQPKATPKKGRSAISDVVAREYTIHLHKRVCQTSPP